MRVDFRVGDVKLLDEGIEQPEVAAFLTELSPEGKRQLDVVKKSFVPWTGSFTERVLKPVRDIVFHYPRDSEMLSLLSTLSDRNSRIEMGSGTFVECRYGVADDVLASYVRERLGGSESRVKCAMEQAVELALALIYFTHEAVALRLHQVDPSALVVPEQDTRR